MPDVDIIPIESGEGNRFGINWIVTTFFVRMKTRWRVKGKLECMIYSKLESRMIDLSGTTTFGGFGHFRTDDGEGDKQYTPVLEDDIAVDLDSDMVQP